MTRARRKIRERAPLVTLPEYALVNLVSGLAVGLLQIHGMPGAAVEALTAIPEVLLPFLRAFLALALPPDMSESPAEVSYHLLYTVMMVVVMLVLLLFVFVGRAGRRRRGLAAQHLMMLLMVVVVQDWMMVVMAVAVDRVIHGMICSMIGGV